MKKMKMAQQKYLIKTNRSMSKRKIRKLSKRKIRKISIKSMQNWPQIITVMVSQNSVCPARKIQRQVNAVASPLCS